MIEIIEASISYKKAIIFDKLQFNIAEDKWTAILGKSGIGKTSLLKLLANLLGEDCNTKLTIGNNISLRDNIAYLPQEDSLLPWSTVYENLLIGSKLRKNTAKLFLKKRAEDILSQVDLQHAKHLYPHQLSGGMRQRLAIARLLLEDKKIILMDEPFKSLDAITRFHLQNFTASLLKNKTVLFITHDLHEATRLSHYIYFMQGTPPTLSLKEELSGDIPRDNTDQSVIVAQKKLYPTWSSI